VKEPLKVPFVLLLILACATFVLAALGIFGTWGIEDSSTRAFGLTYIAQKLPRSLFDVMIPAVVLSIVLIGFRLARRPFSRFLGLLIVLVISYAALVNGMIWFKALSAATRPAQGEPAQYLRPSTFMRIGGVVLNASAVEGSGVRGVLVFDPSRPAPRFTVYGAASASVRAGSMTVNAPGRPPLNLTGAPDLAWTGIFSADPITGAFLRDLGTLTADYKHLLDTSLAQFFAACFSLVLLCTASLVLLRITRWPLVNIMLLIIAVRGYFSLYHLLAVRLAPQLRTILADNLVATFFPSGVLAALGIVLLLVDVLFIPADRWASETGQ
jgi:hypothetical protein